MMGIISGAAWGIAYTDSVVYIAMAAVVGGFVGSAAGAVCFAAMYLFSSKEEDGLENPGKKTALSAPEKNSVRKLPEPSDEKRMKEIEKELKRLRKKRKKRE
ncbi:MAG: hypothetical protein K9J83_03885 [Desulfarculaceae bacterium]|nr:hypothetical protein [Desulfarculaceae bacterium]